MSRAVVCVAGAVIVASLGIVGCESGISGSARSGVAQVYGVDAGGVPSPMPSSPLYDAGGAPLPSAIPSMPVPSAPPGVPSPGTPPGTPTNPGTPSSPGNSPMVP
jgi:hypothetical protein